MDLSGLKWPVIILAVVAVIWLGTSGGVNYMVGNFTKATPGQDAARDKADESSLSTVAGYCMFMMNYGKAAEVLNLAIDRYGTTGANYYYNQFRLAKCLEKLHRVQESYNIIRDLAEINAKQYDGRLPERESLNTRATALRQANNLSE
jgi:hypothetical protein